MISYGRQSIDEDDIRAVASVLRSDWLTQGPKINEFEKALAEYCGARYAVAVSSGTAALHLACLAAGIETGDEVITTPISFAATANAVIYCGGKPVFADIDSDTANISKDEVRKEVNAKTKAIMPVHLAGFPCDMMELYDIARQNKLVIIEDACHALGAEYLNDRSQGADDKSKIVQNRWVRIGSCEHSDMVVFSFHPVKHITTGEGGAILTNSEVYYDKLTLLRSHGIRRDVDKMSTCGYWYYEMQELGFNYRITDIQCALGLRQLRKLPSFLQKRREIALQYDEVFSLIESIRPLREESHVRSAYHLYVVRFDLKKLKATRQEIFDFYRNNRILVNVHYIPIYHHPYYRKIGYGAVDCRNAEDYYNEAVTLPLFPSMTDGDINNVMDTTCAVIEKYS